AVSLAKEGKIAEAIKEAEWGMGGLKELDREARKNLFPEKLAGFGGQDFSDQSAMGVTVIERIYSKGNKDIKVSLTEIGGSNNPLAGMAALGQMFGQTSNQIRLSGRVNGSKNVQGNRVEITASVQNQMLSISSSTASEEEVVGVAKEFPIEAFQAYYSGN
ncbi:MAG TPA: hypothetical protein DCZ03_09695, partial [Gammaproteobacteria bacterium]|nr:hypothetical protein [Gammaproteobacteria bacterium]